MHGCMAESGDGKATDGGMIGHGGATTTGNESYRSATAVESCKPRYADLRFTKVTT